MVLYSIFVVIHGYLWCIVVYSWLFSRTFFIVFVLECQEKKVEKVDEVERGEKVEMVDEVEHVFTVKRAEEQGSSFTLGFKLF